MKHYIIAIALCIYQISFSQNNTIALTTETTSKDLVFRGINRSQIQQKVTLSIDTTGLLGYNGPITKYISALDTIVFARLSFIKGKKWSYATDYSYAPEPTSQEQVVQNKIVKERTLKSIEGLDNGIVLFYDNGCPRCNYAASYMLNNNIPFQLMDINIDKANSQLMWQLIQLEKPELRNVTMPVFLIDGKVSYDIENLRNFTNRLSIFK